MQCSGLLNVLFELVANLFFLVTVTVLLQQRHRPMLGQPGRLASDVLSLPHLTPRAQNHWASSQLLHQTTAPTAQSMSSSTESHASIRRESLLSKTMAFSCRPKPRSIDSGTWSATERRDVAFSDHHCQLPGGARQVQLHSQRLPVINARNHQSRHKSCQGKNLRI